ncbi:hypothetical protein M1563_03620 [Patescibacteria group bacterium]|nr:hypothetical protein [Patescibacteria group bacterium]MCL5410022.1 hypothetical protein [Patescibacteria group bacterium]
MNFNSLLLYSENPNELAKFYREVLDKKPDWRQNSYQGFKIGDGYLMIGPHDKVHGRNQNPERMIFNIEVDDVVGEFDRIKKITGVDIITEPYHPMEANEMWLATLADPDNNFFQLASPMNQEK